jgi:hypothetical protein
MWQRLPKKGNFIDDVIKIESKKIAPNAYKTTKDWNELNTNVSLNGHIHKNQIMYRDRPLESTDLIKRVKKENLPAPGHYKPEHNEKVKFTIWSKEEKRNAIFDMAVEAGKATPAVCYKSVDNLVNRVVKPKIYEHKITKPGKDAEPFHLRPKKSNAPDMGTYQHSKQFHSTQTRKVSTEKWVNVKKPSYLDPVMKRSKGAPAPSTYKVTMDHYARLSASPPSIRPRRH